MKRIVTFFFALLSACTFSAYAAIVDGTCGDNLTWTLNTKDSTLVIAGTGKMANYNDYSSLVPWSDYKSYIKYVTLPDGLTSIGTYAFDGCSKMTSVTIPNSVTSIGDYAFKYCSSLTSITIGNSVTSIGDYAFYSCYSLTSITIPNSITSIGDQAFRECDGLTSVTIGNSVTSIGKQAFQSCSGLTSITIPNSVTSIGASAFVYCSGLTSITIGSGVTSIGNNAFLGCNNIQEVTAYMPTPPTATRCGINSAAATLYVPAEYLEAYQNAVWWEDFAKIHAIGSDWDVEFVDWDGTVLATMKVPNGEAATAPDAPTREGYTFIGWDKDFSSVTEDMTVTAQYQINRYCVRFFDFNDTLLHTDSVEYQAAAVAPADPYHTGYTFTGWDKTFDSITADLDVYAQYEMGEDYDMTIVFTNSEDNDSEIYAQSLTIKVPAAPTIAGFTFLYWQPVAEPITNEITIQAIYEADTPTSTEVYTNPANPAQKLLRNGQVYILQDGKTYTITGQKL